MFYKTFCSVTKKVSKLPSWHKTSSTHSSKIPIQYKPFKDPVKKTGRKKKDEILEEKYMELLNNESVLSLLPSAGYDDPSRDFFLLIPFN